jgi:hypothetical protein
MVFDTFLLAEEPLSHVAERVAKSDLRRGLNPTGLPRLYLEAKWAKLGR